MSAREAQRLMDIMEKAIETAQNSMEEEDRLTHYLAIASEKTTTDKSLRRQLEFLRVERELIKSVEKAAADMEAAAVAQDVLERYLDEAGDDLVEDLEAEEADEEPNNSDDDRTRDSPDQRQIKGFPSTCNIVTSRNTSCLGLEKNIPSAVFTGRKSLIEVRTSLMKDESKINFSI
ncbi:unnamed protein product [Caenorhabditis auriculariae]|uniref:Uncharacterized protein n=1 Tax=Caenorhabditis auriculariae TaxID=2777116 RepID=A0A8S1H931_9PELO|nr:unnamed protein product [Caenorhabditis auriculariae]